MGQEKNELGVDEPAMERAFIFSYYGNDREKFRAECVELGEYYDQDSIVYGVNHKKEEKDFNEDYKYTIEHINCSSKESPVGAVKENWNTAHITAGKLLEYFTRVRVRDFTFESELERRGYPSELRAFDRYHNITSLQKLGLIGDYDC